MEGLEINPCEVNFSPKAENSPPEPALCQSIETRSKSLEIIVLRDFSIPCRSLARRMQYGWRLKQFKILPRRNHNVHHQEVLDQQQLSQVHLHPLRPGCRFEADRCQGHRPSRRCSSRCCSPCSCPSCGCSPCGCSPCGSSSRGCTSRRGTPCGCSSRRQLLSLNSGILMTGQKRQPSVTAVFAFTRRGLSRDWRQSRIPAPQGCGGLQRSSRRRKLQREWRRQPAAKRHAPRRSRGA